MTSSINSISTRIDRAIMAIDRKRRPMLIHCAGAREQLLAELSRYGDQGQEEESIASSMTPEEFNQFCEEMKDVLDQGVRHIEETYNVRFVE